MKNLRITLFCLLALVAVALHAQQSMNTSGTTITGTTGNVSYSVGQTAFGSYSGTSGYIIEGAQQPYEISVVSGLKEAKDISLTWSVFPNPASEFICLKLNETNLLGGSTLRFQFIDTNGKVIQENRITGNITKINLKNLNPSTYFLKIIQNNTEKITYKIIKN